MRFETEAERRRRRLSNDPADAFEPSRLSERLWELAVGAEVIESRLRALCEQREHEFCLPARLADGIGLELIAAESLRRELVNELGSHHPICTDLHGAIGYLREEVKRLLEGQSVREDLVGILRQPLSDYDDGLAGKLRRLSEETQ